MLENFRRAEKRRPSNRLNPANNKLPVSSRRQALCRQPESQEKSCRNNATGEQIRTWALSALEEAAK